MYPHLIQQLPDEQGIVYIWYELPKAVEANEPGHKLKAVKRSKLKVGHPRYEEWERKKEKAKEIRHSRSPGINDYGKWWKGEKAPAKTTKEE